MTMWVILAMGVLFGLAFSFQQAKIEKYLRQSEEIQQTMETASELIKSQQALIDNLKRQKALILFSRGVCVDLIDEMKDALVKDDPKVERLHQIAQSVVKTTRESNEVDISSF